MISVTNYFLSHSKSFGLDSSPRPLALQSLAFRNKFLDLIEQHVSCAAELGNTQKTDRDDVRAFPALHAFPCWAPVACFYPHL